MAFIAGNFLRMPLVELCQCINGRANLKTGISKANIYWACMLDNLSALPCLRFCEELHVSEETQPPSAPEKHGPSATEIQVELARTRTLLALDRTLLAWVRTSLSLIAFGFTLAKFVHDLIGHGLVVGIDAHYPRHFGVALMILGISGLLAGAFDYWRAVQRLKTSVDMPVWSTSLIMALCIAAIAIFLIVSLLADLKLQ